MRLIKMFGLAAIAVSAFMAFVGATSAMATALEEVVLCSVQNEIPCVNNRLGSGTVIHSTSSNALLLGGLFNISCAESKTLGTTTSELAHGEITALSFTNCIHEGTTRTCTATAERLNYLVKGELQPTDSGYELLVTAKVGSERPEVRVICEADGINCQYGAETVLLEQIEPEGVGHVVLKVLQSLTGLGVCFTSATWHAEYLTKCLSGTSEIGCWLRMEK